MKPYFLTLFPHVSNCGTTAGSLRKHPFLLALRRWGRLSIISPENEFELKSNQTHLILIRSSLSDSCIAVMSQSAFHYVLTVQSFIKLNKVTEEGRKKKLTQKSLHEQSSMPT